MQRCSPTGVFLSKMVTARLRPGTMSKSELNEFIEEQTNCNCRSQSRHDVVVLNVPADLVPAQRCRPKCVYFSLNGSSMLPSRCNVVFLNERIFAHVIVADSCPGTRASLSKWQSQAVVQVRPVG